MVGKEPVDCKLITACGPHVACDELDSPAIISRVTRFPVPKKRTPCFQPTVPDSCGGSGSGGQQLSKSGPGAHWREEEGDVCSTLSP